MEPMGSRTEHGKLNATKYHKTKGFCQECMIRKNENVNMRKKGKASTSNN